MNNPSQNSTKRRFPLPVGCILYPALGLLVLGIVGYILLQYANYNSALKTAKEWARLNDFPTSATHVTAVIEGGFFSRGLTIEFEAPLPDIEKWLNESPGTKNAIPTVDGNIRKYEIEPGGGAQHAELELDEDSGHVKIHTYWS